jgi:hypothetical protein
MMEGLPPNREWVPEFSHFLDRVDKYNNAVQKREKFRLSQPDRSSPWQLKYYGPILIAIALALRMTKVSGEIERERRKVAQSQA